MALNPQHDLRINTSYFIGVRWQEEFFRDIVADPLNEILGFTTCEQFVAHPVDAEYSTFPVMVKQAFPEAGANVERVIEVLCRNEDIRVHKVVLIRH